MRNRADLAAATAASSASRAGDRIVVHVPGEAVHARAEVFSTCGGAGQ